MDDKKIIYIAGPITGVRNYWEPFEQAEEILTELGYIVLTPTRLPSDTPNGKAMKVCMSMIDIADAVVFLPGWASSSGARLEKNYCEYIDKKHIPFKTSDNCSGESWPKKVISAWVGCQLEEVLKDG